MDKQTKETLIEAVKIIENKEERIIMVDFCKAKIFILKPSLGGRWFSHQNAKTG